MSEMFDISGKVALVTGGSKGIGFGVAEGLAAAGAEVVIANRDAAAGEKAVKRLAEKGLVLTSMQTDVSKYGSIKTAIDRVVGDHGKIDILVNNAGAIVRKLALDISEEEYDQVADTNLKGTFFASQIAAGHMKDSGGGRIINISSITGEIVHLKRSVYAATKAGIAHMTRSLAYELGEYDINVNAIGPGMTYTEFNEQFWKDNPDQLERVVNCIPKGRGGYPADYVGAVVFLSSPAADFITGQHILVDGGSFLSWAGS